MERIALIACSVILVLIIAALGFFFFSNPVAAQKTALAAELATVKSDTVPFEKPKRDFEKWQQAIAAKPALWKELIEQPPPPPPPPPQKPDLDKMIEGVTASRAQVGGKVKLMKKGDTHGEFMAVGDTINGLTIKEITKTDVVLSLDFNGQELTVKLPRG